MAPGDHTLDGTGRGLETGPVTRLSAVDPESLPRVREHAHGVKGWGDLLEVSAQTGRDRAGGLAWKTRLGSHRPAVTVLEVAGLLDDEALVAIEAVALV